MLVCMIVAAIIAIFSIFAFFGSAFSNTGGLVVPNMFHLMFGLRQNAYGLALKWKMYTGMLIIFIVEIIILLVATYVLYVATMMYRKKASFKTGASSLVLLGILSLPAIVLSFLTLKLVGSDVDSSSGVGLGAGPIIYSVLQIFVLIICIVGLALYYQREKRGVGATCDNSAYSEPEATSIPAPNITNENEKADLILKYKKMLDDGVITQEEFEKKKKELLG